MKYDPTKHHRRSIRLKGYDYHDAGAYFATICTKNREYVLNDVIVTEIIMAVWRALPQWFPTIELDEFVVMPNHIHFVIWILDGSVGIPLRVSWRMVKGMVTSGHPLRMPIMEAIRMGASPVPTCRNRKK